MVFSSKTGEGYLVDTKSRNITSEHLPRDLVWLGDEGVNLVGQRASGEIDWIDRRTYKILSALGAESKNSRPAAIPGAVAFADKVWTPSGVIKLSSSLYPPADATLQFGRSGGRPVLIEFRKGNDYHRGELVLLRRGITPADSVIDRPYEGSESFLLDSSNDGLLDGWKTAGFRGLDLKALGCTPGHADVVCLVSRFEEVQKGKAGVGNGPCHQVLRGS